MKYYLAKFFRYIPQINGMNVIGGIDNFSVITATDAALAELRAHPDDIPVTEITEEEATSRSFYGETRGYRRAYSDVEGLAPDPDELAKGKRKTKVYITDAQKAAVTSLMKKAMHFHLDVEMDDRKKEKLDLEGKKRPKYDKKKHDDLKKDIDKLKTIDEIVQAREEVLGIEMSKDLAVRLNKWDESKDRRKGFPLKFGYKF
jgi:hypothetical protein